MELMILSGHGRHSSRLCVPVNYCFIRKMCSVLFSEPLTVMDIFLITWHMFSSQKKKFIKVVAETSSIYHPGTHCNNIEELLKWIEYFPNFRKSDYIKQAIYVHQPNKVNQKLSQYLSIRICDRRHAEYWSLPKFHLHEYKQNFVGLKVVPVYYLKYVNCRLILYHRRKTF